MKDVKISNRDQFLMCPHCENETIMPQKTTVYSLDGRVIICDKSEQKTTFTPIQANYKPNMVIQDTDTSTNKSNDAHAISVNFYCKSCKSYSEMYLSNHLGSTHFGWAKSVHVDEKDYTKAGV